MGDRVGVSACGRAGVRSPIEDFCGVPRGGHSGKEGFQRPKTTVKNMKQFPILRHSVTAARRGQPARYSLGRRREDDSKYPNVFQKIPQTANLDP